MYYIIYALDQIEPKKIYADYTFVTTISKWYRDFDNVIEWCTVLARSTKKRAGLEDTRRHVTRERAARLHYTHSITTKP